MKLAIIGGGSWGTALAIVLAPRFEAVRLWVYEAELAARMESTRENFGFLPGFRLPENVSAAPLIWSRRSKQADIGLRRHAQPARAGAVHGHARRI